jgi:hypothetical protein
LVPLENPRHATNPHGGDHAPKEVRDAIMLEEKFFVTPK